jgi:MFS family permease
MSVQPNTRAKTGLKPPTPSARYANVVLALLTLAYTFNFIDRTIIATLGQPIKDSLKISDTQLGLLGGLYFALLYTALGIPLARLAERTSRVNIISLAILVWSGFTALCGTAANFTMLAAYRFGVGVGEAGLSPPAHSLISDYFPPKKRASALAIYSFGIPLGTMIGAVAGGFIAKTFGWRWAFAVVGIPGVLVALAMKLLIKEPARGGTEPEREPAVADPAATDLNPAPAIQKKGELAEIGAVIRNLFGSWPVFNMVMGITLVSFGGYGGGQFASPYFIRTFGLDYATVGLISGLVGGLSSGIGTLVGGPITDRLSRGNERWYALAPAIGVTLAFPFIIGIYTAHTWHVAAAFMLLPGMFSYIYLGPTFGVIQNVSPVHQRATTAAVMLFFLNLIALGGGPPITGWIIDRFAAFHYAHPQAVGLWDAIGGFFSVHGTTFQAECPGGKAAVGASAAAQAACHGSLVLATRHGVMVAYAVGLWGAFHYLLASFGIKAVLDKAAADRLAAQGSH